MGRYASAYAILPEQFFRSRARSERSERSKRAGAIAPAPLIPLVPRSVRGSERIARSVRGSERNRSACSIHVRVRPQVLERLLPHLFHVHQVQPLAEVFALGLALGLLKQESVFLPVLVAAGLAALFQSLLPP